MDWVSSPIPEDTVSFGPGIGVNDLALFKSADNNLIIKVGGNGDQIDLVGWYDSREISSYDEDGWHSSLGYPFQQVARFAFADGTELSVDALLSQNHLHFVPSMDAYGKLSITGTLGDDQIDGGAGDETINGWLGADTLAGGDGADTYRFNLGDGADTIDNYDTTGLDTVAFGDGITLDSLKWCRSSDDLVVRVGADGDQLIVRSWFGGSAYQVDRFTFFDGTVLGNDPSLQGSAGQDLLTGTSGSDTLQGGAGNDLLSGGDGNDTYMVNLGDGVDQLMDTGGADTILFGAGITPESLTLGLGSLLIRVGDQGDALHLAGFDAESPFTSSVIETFQFADGTVLDIAGLLQGGFDIHGTAGDDLLRGTAVIDRMDGGAGADTMAGGAGSDQLAGDDGDDTLSGGEDNDSLDGGSGDDWLQGEAGHDQMDGGAGADTLEGGAGSDQLAGGDGDDTLSGGEDNDSLNGSSGNDWLQGGAGHDQLSGNQGDDTLDGGSGDDTYLFGLGDGADTIVNDDAMGGGDGVSFGAGIGQNALDLLKTGDSLLIRVGRASDQLLFSHWFAGSNFQVDQFTFADGTTVSASDLLAQKPLYSFSQGSEGDDTLLGHDGLDIINGYGGNDTLSGAASNDRLYGGDGDDTMFGGVGNDMLAGSQGNDTLDGGLGDDIYFVGSRIGDGEDTINNDDETGFDAVCLADGIAPGDLALLKSGDNLCVRIGVYTGQHIGFHSWPNLTFNQWFAGSNYQVDQFIFADGTTMSASDLLAQKELYCLGTDGDDSLAGYEAWDAMYGYAGNDTMYGLGGADWLYGGDGDDTLQGGEGNDWLWGDTGNDTLLGGTGNDWLDGKQGSDVLDGGSGDDWLYGGDDGNTLQGGAGRDWLEGKQGNDVLDGGSGDDYYSFQLGDGADTIVNDDPSGDDRVIFGQGIALADLALLKSDNNLVVQVGNQGDQLTFCNWFAGRSHQADWFSFDAGRQIISASGLVEGLPVYSQGTAGDDLLAGYEGFDRMQGGAGNDTLSSGAGNDVMDGGDGDDTYAYSLGDGQDSITNNDGAGFDQVILGPGITPDNLSLMKSGDNLVVTFAFNNNSDQLVFNDWFAGSRYQVDQFSFVDDGTLSTDDLLEQRLVFSYGTADDECLAGSDWPDVLLGFDGDDALHGVDGADQLYGFDGDDTLLGGAGDDWLYGDAGNDILQGDSGNDWLGGNQGDDTLDGGPGDDVYLFGIDDGADTINNNDETGFEEVRLHDVLSLADLALFKSGEDLIMKAGGNGDQLTFAHWFLGSGYQVDQFRLDDDDETTLSSSDLLGQKPVYSQGTDGDDVLAGYDGFDMMQGGAGNDILYGHGGNNQLLGGLGNDILEGGADGGNTLDGGAGNDMLEGRGGNNVFIFGRGYGQDIASLHGDGTVAANNVVRFLPDVAAAEVMAAQTSGGGADLLLSIAGTDDMLTIAGFFDPLNGQNQRINAVEFADGVVWTAEQLAAILHQGSPPVVAAPLADQMATADEPFVFTVPAGAFVEGTPGDCLTYAATLANGEALPVWLGFDPATRTFSGRPLNAAAGGWDVRVTATGNAGVSVSDDFMLDIAHHVVGSAAGNALAGTELRDVLEGLGGNDVINGAGGNDIIDGGIGSDSLQGGAGDDLFLIAGTDSGYDSFNGGEGFDTILGSAGDDTIRLHNFSAANTVELIDGGAGCNIIAGTDSGNLIDLRATTLINIDYIASGAGNDTVLGANGNDIIDGGIGSDSLQGGAGDDLFLLAGTDSGYDSFNGGEGVDTILGSAGDDTIRLHNFSAANTVEVIDGGAGCNIIAGTDSGNLIDLRATTLLHIDHITSGAGNDTVLGSPGNDIIDGGIGSDILQGGAGDDLFLLVGTDSGYDSFNGGEGVDTILGSAGDDTIRLHNFSAANTVEVIDGGAGCNIIAGTDSGNLIDLRSTTLLHIDHITSGAGNDTVFGSPGNDIIDGGIGSDILQGGAGDDLFLLAGTDSGYDSFSGGEGVDTIQGSAGDDTIRLHNFSAANTVELIDGGAGCNVIAGTDSGNLIDLSATTLLHIDHITSGAGNDTVLGANGNDIIDGGIGSDSLQGGAGDDLFLLAGTDSGYDSFNGGEGFDTILGSAGDDTIRLHNFSAANTVELIDGGAGCNVIAGTDSGNLIDLRATTLINIDHIASGAGNDTVFGSDGNDTLIGGTGSDSLQGGAGNDTYRFTLGDGSDSINNNDPSGVDTVAFDLNVIKTAIGLFKSGNNLEVGYSGSDKVTVSNFFAGANTAVDTVNLADGSYLSAADINQVVQDMAAYAVNQGIAMNSMADVRNNAQLMNLVAGAWHV